MLAPGSPKQRALLGLLLLHANEPIARERLVEELWAGTAPRTVNQVLNVYLSRLRRLLTNGTDEQPLVTHAAGYVLRVPPDGLDARRFEALLGRGRRELAGGDAERASATLREALALWRGPALADLAFEPFAQTEIARLEELRLTALEARIDADLDLGRHDSLVAELETLVTAHPYREGLRAQLMLALYRSGRQAESLETYSHARRTFSEELGIEPGPRLQELERAILRQDPTLQAHGEEQPARAEGQVEVVRSRRRLRTRSTALLATGLALVVAVAVAAAARDPLGHSAVPVTLEGDSVVVVDPETNTIVGEIPVGERPVGPAVGEGSIWVASHDDQTLLRIDPGSREVVRTIGVGGTPIDVEVGAGGVWVLSERALFRIDPAVNKVVATIPLSGASLARWNGMEVGPHGVYLCRCGPIPGDNFARVDPVTSDIEYIRVGPVSGAAYGQGSLWVLIGYESDTIVRIDSETDAVVARIPLGRIGELHGYHYRLAVGEDAVWLASRQSLWRIDPRTNRLLGSIPLGGITEVTASAGHAEGSIAAGYGSVWVASFGYGVFHVDPESRTVGKTIPLGTLMYPAGTDAMAVGEGAVWLAVTSYAS